MAFYYKECKWFISLDDEYDYYAINEIASSSRYDLSYDPRYNMYYTETEEEARKVCEEIVRLADRMREEDEGR